MAARSDLATFLVGNTSGSTVLQGVPLYLSGGSNVTVHGLIGTAGHTLAIHGASGGTGGGGGVAIAAGTQTATTNTVVFSNSNGVTFGMSGSSRVTASVETAYAASTHSHGNPSLALTNLTGTTASNSAGLTISLSAAAPGAGGGIAAAAGTQTQTSGTLVFANSNGLTFGMSGSSQVTASHNGLTTAALSNHSHAFATTTTGGASIVVGTSNSAGVTIGVPAYLTTARASNDGLGTATAATNVTWTANSAGVSLNASGYAGTGTSATNASVTLNSAGLAISVAAPGGGAAQTFSAGTASGAANPVYFSNANGVTFGLGTGASSSVITASVAAAGGGAAPARRYMEIIQGERFTTIANLSQTNFSNRILFMPFWADGTGIALNTVRFMVTGIGSSNRSLGGTIQAALYGLVNDTQITLLTSDSMSFSITASSQSSVWNGFRALDFTRMTGYTMTSEGRHVLAFLKSMVSNNATWANVGIYGADPFPVFSGGLGYATSTATNSASQILPYWGGYSATTASFPNSVGQTQINGHLSASVLDVYAILKEI